MKFDGRYSRKNKGEGAFDALYENVEKKSNRLKGKDVRNGKKCSGCRLHYRAVAHCARVRLHILHSFVAWLLKQLHVQRHKPEDVNGDDTEYEEEEDDDVVDVGCA